MGMAFYCRPGRCVNHGGPRAVQMQLLLCVRRVRAGGLNCRRVYRSFMQQRKIYHHTQIMKNCTRLPVLVIRKNFSVR